MRNYNTVFKLIKLDGVLVFPVEYNDRYGLSRIRASLLRFSRKTGRKFTTKQNGRGGLIVKRIV